jgi:hypothetical protein
LLLGGEALGRGQGQDLAEHPLTVVFFVRVGAALAEGGAFVGRAEIGDGQRVGTGLEGPVCWTLKREDAGELAAVEPGGDHVGVGLQDGVSAGSEGDRPVDGVEIGRPRRGGALGVVVGGLDIRQGLAGGPDACAGDLGLFAKCLGVGAGCSGGRGRRGSCGGRCRLGLWDAGTVWDGVGRRGT